MLSLLNLSGQQDRDAVMILHMGGAFGDKAATLDRFRENYAKLSPAIKDRLVLENDDVVWTVHDLLPICEELNIPLVLDFHHHNIHFDSSTGIREGTLDIMQLFPRIKATWARKSITQKMHYSEPQPSAITPRERRRHSARVQILPPCDPDMDLMIEAKDKEQAVFDLMRTYKLPGFEKINDVVPYDREDQPSKKIGKKGVVDDEGNGISAAGAAAAVDFPVEELGMGGPLNRVYWPIGMEAYLRPKKITRSNQRKTRAKTKKQQQNEGEGEGPETTGDGGDQNEDVESQNIQTTTPKTRKGQRKKNIKAKPLSSPSPSSPLASPSSLSSPTKGNKAALAPATPTRRSARRNICQKREIYREEQIDEEIEVKEVVDTAAAASEVDEEYTPVSKKRRTRQANRG